MTFRVRDQGHSANVLNKIMISLTNRRSKGLDIDIYNHKISHMEQHVTMAFYVKGQGQRKNALFLWNTIGQKVDFDMNIYILCHVESKSEVKSLVQRH